MSKLDEINKLLDELSVSADNAKAEKIAAEERAKRADEEARKINEAKNMFEFAKEKGKEFEETYDAAMKSAGSMGVQINDEKNKKEKKSKKNNNGVKGFIAGVLATSITLTGGHFIAVGIKNAKDNKNDKNISNVQEYSVDEETDNALASKFREFLENKGIVTVNEMASGRVAVTPLKTELTASEIDELSKEFFTDKLFTDLLGSLDIETEELTEESKIAFCRSYLEDTLNFEIKEVEYEYNYDENAVVIEDENYVELTTEEFENLTSLKIKELSDKGINLASEDVIKYAMIVNSDKLAQDNKELITEIVGEQEADEVQQDAYKVVGAIVMYNYNTWYKEGKTDNFVKVSDFIFDEMARNKVITIENRVNEIALSVNDKDKMNELVHSLLLDLTNPESELSYLESGVTFAVQTILEPVRGLYGMDLYGNIILDETNAELIKYFVPYAGDEQKYIDNNMLTGAIQDIHNTLSDCPNHTKTK